MMIERNQSQKRAIAHLSGPMLVLAGPGSGKTSVIVERTEYLIKSQGIAESSILVVTFSRAAAKEMKERFLRQWNKKATRVTFGTFHGVFYGILKQAYGLTAENILKPEQKQRLMRELICSYCPDMKDERDFMEELFAEISMVKGNRIALEHYYSSSCPDEVFRKIFLEYTAYCKKQRLLDFDDMLVYCYELFQKRSDILEGWQQRFRYILVDEFQDINQLQYDILRMLAQPEDNLFIVGDDDQSIYHFRGARPEIMLNFQKDYPQAQKVLLDINYRSTESILKGAGKLILNNKARYGKDISTPNQTGEGITIREYANIYEEALAISKELAQCKERGEDLREIAVLSRTNVETGFLVEKLMEYQIPFQMRDSLPNLYEHWIAGDMFAYLKLAGGDYSRGNFLRIMNRPNRYISREAVYDSRVSFEELRMFYEEKEWMCDRIDALETHMKRLKGLNPYGGINYVRHAIGYEEYLSEYAAYRKIKPEELYEVLDRLQESARGFSSMEDWEKHIREYTRKAREQQEARNQEGTGVTIATLHSSKGLEFDCVYIFNVNEGMIPYRRAQLVAQVEEERRLFYVGMTRARKSLTLCWVNFRFDKRMEPSRFLEELHIVL